MITSPVYLSCVQPPIRTSLLLALVVCFLSASSWNLLSPSPTLAQTKPAWQQQWEQTVDAAKRERKLVVFGPAGDLIRKALMEAFRKSFPEVALEYAGGRAAEQAMRIKAERDGGVFSVDVFIGGAVTMMELGSHGALERIDPALILPQVKEPKYWRDGRLEFTNPDTRYTLVFSSQPNPPVIYDSKQVKVNTIDELYELLDPRWKGRAVINRAFITTGSNRVKSFFLTFMRRIT